MARKAVGSCAPLYGTVKIGSGSDVEVDPRLRGRDRHFDGGLRFEVGVGLRLGDDLDRIGAALEPRRGGRGDVAVGVDRDRPARRGVCREVVGVGEARLEFGWKVTGVFWSVVNAVGADRHLEHVARVAVQGDRVGAVAVGRDGDGPVVAVQGRFVLGVERRCRRRRGCRSPARG